MSGARERARTDGEGGGGTLLRWLPALLWAGAIFFLSSRSRLPEPPGILGWDKLQHSLAYGLGGFLIGRATGARGRGMLLAIVIGSLYGASDELHQWFVPGRDSDVLDWVADTLGVTIGAFIHRTILLRRGGASAGAVDYRTT